MGFLLITFLVLSSLSDGGSERIFFSKESKRKTALAVMFTKSLLAASMIICSDEEGKVRSEMPRK